MRQNNGNSFVFLNKVNARKKFVSEKYFFFQGLLTSESNFDMDCSRPVGMGPRRRGLSDIRSFLQAESNERLHRYRERERERLHVRGEAQPLISQQTSDVQIGK